MTKKITFCEKIKEVTQVKFRVGIWFSCTVFPLINIYVYIY